MSALMKKADVLYAWFVKMANLLQSPLLLAIRLYWGWQFWQTGYGHLTNIAKTIEYFGSLGLPAPAFTAYAVGVLEAVGGVLLFLGLGARLIALPLTINLITAFVVAEREALGSIFSDPDKLYAAAPYTFLFASLLILVFGPGKLSIDALIARYRAKKQAAQPAVAS
ncbi:MAG TPA: DoxX family protein [Alphaproteobacteria bacterium]|nr:DoxX family protein [Alphaproteobacteria bacterium]